MVPPNALASDSISAKTIAAEVGFAKTAARVLRALEFTGPCYRKLLAHATPKPAKLRKARRDEKLADQTVQVFPFVRNAVGGRHLKL
jgi:hypothetical protein